MSCDIRPSGATQGAVVAGVSLTDLGDADSAVIQDAFQDHVAIWNNRCVLHRARPYHPGGCPRRSRWYRSRVRS